MVSVLSSLVPVQSGTLLGSNHAISEPKEKKGVMTDKERAIINTFNYLYDHAILCPQCGKYMILPIYKCFGCGCDIDVYREEQDNARLEAYHEKLR